MHTPRSDSTIALLEDLVAIDSVNPSLVSGAAGEAEIARRIAAECTAAGLTVTMNEVAPGRPNVVATFDGPVPGPALMFCGHVDTVGVAGMEHPFRPVQRDGRLYGRGVRTRSADATVQARPRWRTAARQGRIAA